jgi:hypothetical protein
MRTRTILPAATLLGGLALAHVSVHAEESQPTDTHGWIGTETRFEDFEFKNGYPTSKAADALLDQRTLNRAIEIYRTQIPAIAETRRGVRDYFDRFMGRLLSSRTDEGGSLLNFQVVVVFRGTSPLC